MKHDDLAEQPTIADKEPQDTGFHVVLTADQVRALHDGAAVTFELNGEYRVWLTEGEVARTE